MAEKDAYYFSHDANARHDPKISDMRSIYGMQGYGWYWVIVEMMREQANYKLKLCKANATAMQMQCDNDTTSKFVNDCINEFELFDSDGEYFWSNSLIRRMKQKEEKSNKYRENALKRWDKSKEICNSNAMAMQSQSNGNALKESKVKESKVNKNKIYYSEFVQMEEDQYQKLIEKYGLNYTNEMIDNLNNYIGSLGKKGINKYKSHYHTILSWANKDTKGGEKQSGKVGGNINDFDESKFYA